jgi:hypothetical protein
MGAATSPGPWVVREDRVVRPLMVLRALESDWRGPLRPVIDEVLYRLWRVVDTHTGSALLPGTPAVSRSTRSYAGGGNRALAPRSVIPTTIDNSQTARGGLA